MLPLFHLPTYAPRLFTKRRPSNQCNSAKNVSVESLTALPNVVLCHSRQDARTNEAGQVRTADKGLCSWGDATAVEAQDGGLAAANRNRHSLPAKV